MRESLSSLIEKPISGEWGNEGEGINVLRTTNFTNDGTLDFSNVVKRQVDQKKIDKKKLLIGDIIIEKSGGSPTQPVGRVVFFEKNGDYVCNNFTSVLRPKKEKVFPKFLFYQLFTNHLLGNTQKFQNKTTGIINLKLTNYINEIQIPLPPLEEQKRIAAILDAADLHRQKTKELIAKYDELAQALFLDMFGDPVSNPKVWEKVELEKVCLKIFGGGTPSKSKPEYYVGNIPWVTPKDMKSNFISDSIDHINQNAINNSSTKLIPKNSLLMVIRSGILKHTLPVGINLVDVSINQDMKAFIPNLNLTSPEFLLYFFKTIQSFLLSKVRAVTADNIEFSQIKNIGFPIVPKELITKFSEKVKICLNQKSQAEKSIQKAEELFQSLLQKAFNGEL